MLNSNNTYRYLDFVGFSQLYNWSVQYLNDSKIRFTTKYPLVPIKDFLLRNKTAIEIQNNTYYKRATIKIRNGGISLRDEVIGSKIGTKNQFIISKGQFLLSKIDARNGAFGVVPEELDGGVITGNFWTFDVDYSKVNPHYLTLLTTTKEFISFCEQASNGTTNRHYLQEHLFLNIKVPLPSLNEQKILVDGYNKDIDNCNARLEKGENKNKEAKTYLSENIGISEFYTNNSPKKHGLIDFISFSKIREWGTDKVFNSRIYLSSKYKTQNLNSDDSLYIDIKRGKSPKYCKTSNAFILNQKCIRWGSLEVKHAKTVDPIWLQSVNEDSFTQEGDILINSTGEGTIGRAAIVDKDHIGLLYDSHVLLLRLNKNYFNPQYFVFVFNSDYGQRQVDNVKSAKTTKQTELGVENLKRIFIPIPPISVQDDIVKKLTAIQEEVANLQNVAPYYEKAVANFESQIFE